MSGQWGASHSVRSEVLFLDTANSRGTTVTASGSANAKGSWITAVQNTFAYEQINVCIHHGGGAVDYVLDIGIDDGAGNIFILCADLRYPNRRGTREAYVCYEIPVHVPSGARLRVRSAASSASATCAVILTGFSSGYGGMPGFSRLIALYSPATSRGVAVDPGGTAATRVRTEIIASSAQRIAGLLFMIGHNADVSRAASARLIFDIETGSSGNERKLISDCSINWGATGDGPCTFSFPHVPCDVQTAQRFSVYAECDINTAGDRTVDFAMWGLVP